jgi:hypothetical protein
MRGHYDIVTDGGRHGTHFLGFNAIMNWNDLGAGK